MKILDSLFKNIPAMQNAPAALRGTDKAGTADASATQADSEAGSILADLKEQGYVLSAEESDRIAEFIENTDGTGSEKLQTIKTALDKGLPLTARSLQSIRAALFQPALPRELQTILGESGSDVSAEQVELIRAFARMAVEEEAGAGVSSEQGAQLTKTLAVTGQGMELAGTGAESADEDQVTAWLLKAFEKVAALSDSLGVSVEETVETESPGREQPVRHMTREPRARQMNGVVMQEEEPESAVTKAPEKTSDKETGPIPEEEQDIDHSIEEAIGHLISGIGQQEADPAQGAANGIPSEALIQGISLLMKEITPKMAAVKTEFETMRKTLTANLDGVRAELARPEAVNKPQVVEKLSQAIEKLDKAILKSDIPLYTSMKAEKQLLNWSSELQEARSLVSDGQNAKAAEIVDRISKGVQEIQFQPAKMKVIHRVLQQAVSVSLSTEKGIGQRAQQQINRILEPAHTPREVLETFKAIGLTHESEVASALGQSGKKIKDDWLPQENLKEMLMKLAADTQEKLTTVTGAEKALNNLTGQQLLSRPEAKPQGQTLFFSVPMEVANRVEDLKIYVQSRKDKGKVDWENCTFYFAVHTEKFGDVGIRFAAARKSVSIQVKCDNQALRDAVSPMVDDFKQAMWETGYKIAGISYSPLKDAKPAAPKTEDVPDAEADGNGVNLRV